MTVFAKMSRASKLRTLRAILAVRADIVDRQYCKCGRWPVLSESKNTEQVRCVHCGRSGLKVFIDDEPDLSRRVYLATLAWNIEHGDDATMIPF